MRHAYVVIIVLIAAAAVPTEAQAAASWVASPNPTLNPTKIQVGAGDWFTSGYTVTVIQGETVNVRATSQDKDTRTEGCENTQVADTPNVVWSKTDGTLSGTRVASGATVVWTAPTLGEEETSRNCTVTAKPDDNTTTAPGNRPPGDTGDRNDDLGTGVNIVFKVIKNCPTTAGLGSSCTIGHTTWFAAGKKTSGFTTVQTQVSGGTPPTPPNNWNGLFIKETVALHPTDSGTGVDDDFEVAGYRAASCQATVQGFVVGFSPGAIGTCARAAADDRFWDDHFRVSNSTTLKNGKPDKTVICQQKYYCKTTQLNTAGANNAFKITSTYHENTYDPDGEGPEEAYRVTEVTLTKATD